MISVALMALFSQPGVMVSKLFSDNAVLQRDIAAPVFGTGTPGEAVRVEIGRQRRQTKVGADGTWLVRLEPMPAGGRLSLRVNGKPVAENITFGEVWVASGQSNIEWPVAASSNPVQEAQNADARVRMFTVAKLSEEVPQREVRGSWEIANRSTVGGFSGVGYAFARNLAERLNVPVGVIHTSWGGTPAEAWTSRERLKKNPELAIFMERYQGVLNGYPDRLAQWQRDHAAWRRETRREDSGNEGFEKGWAGPNLDDSGWRNAALPGPWERTMTPFDGAVWYRKVVEVPADWAGKPLRLELGSIDDFDITYFNGTRVGTTPRGVENSWRVPRNYWISPGLVRPGRNVIAVRVFDEMGEGGFNGSPDAMRLTRIDGQGGRIELAGEWKMQVEREIPPIPQELLAREPQRPFGPGNPWAPGGLYNGMIAPLIPYGIRGAIWYQGESNADRAMQYRTLFPEMIRDWRTRWGLGDFPFYFVQLANFMARNAEPMEAAWPELREAQSYTAKTVRNTGQAVIIDIGEADDIHPRNKRDVGQRLALIALNRTYGKKDVAYSGPAVMRAEIGPASMRIVFDTPLRTSDGKAPAGFQIAGRDRKWVWADVRLEGNVAIVASPKVPAPVAVRYGWGNNPAVNLTNATGLPASPFRTDDWPGVTDRNR